VTRIEHRREAGTFQPDYAGRVFSAEQVAGGEHRAFVGGMWDEHGPRQLDFLIGRGLRPQHRLLDIGCGPFRAGRLLVDHLEPGHYYGVDANLSLLQAGYDVELTDEQRARLPVANLRANDRFDVDFGVGFDYAIAQSVFTHVSLNHIRLCLFRAARAVRPGGSLFATFFERGPSTPVDHIVNAGRPRPQFSERNVFWYYRADLAWAARVAPWRMHYVGDWGHPVGQRMVEFVRLDDPTPPPPPPADLRSRGRRYAARTLRAAARRVEGGRR
jgi:SAM-dependent methyltransferase